MPFDQSPRVTFDQAAIDYDRYRPGYPAQVLTEMLAFASIGADSRVLEIGCGTGKATLPLTERGIQIDAVELGPKLAAVARRNCREWPAVTITTGDFESGSWEPGTYDLVFSAQAFHWIHPEVRLTKTWELLRANGSLALLYNYPRPPTDPALISLTAAVERDSGGSIPAGDGSDEIARWTGELEESDLFQGLRVHRHPWAKRYTAAEYQGLFRTYSGYLTLPGRVRERIAGTIRRTIDEHGGSVVREYECVLFLLRRSPGEQNALRHE